MYANTLFLVGLSVFLVTGRAYGRSISFGDDNISLDSFFPSAEEPLRLSEPSCKFQNCYGRPLRVSDPGTETTRASDQAVSLNRADEAKKQMISMRASDLAVDLNRADGIKQRVSGGA